MPGARSLKLAGIGTLAGLFSGVFGVGGGSVIVPLLILWMAYDERAAGGTSLLAIIPIAATGAVAQAAYGNIHVGDALLVGLPALLGVSLGTRLQQKVPARGVSLLFAGLLVCVAVELVVQ
jgi:uncharacterized membrane protein YfcA